MMAGNYLPGVLGFIAEELGKELAIEFAKAFGGREVYIPERVGSESRLARALGHEEAKQIAKLLGRGDLLVPCGNLGGGGARRAKIVELYHTGLSHSQIAECVGVHIRTVERNIAGLENPDEPGLPF